MRRGVLLFLAAVVLVQASVLLFVLTQPAGQDHAASTHAPLPAHDAVPDEAQCSEDGWDLEGHHKLWLPFYRDDVPVPTDAFEDGRGSLVVVLLTRHMQQQARRRWTAPTAVWSCLFGGAPPVPSSTLQTDPHGHTHVVTCAVPSELRAGWPAHDRSLRNVSLRAEGVGEIVGVQYCRLPPPPEAPADLGACTEVLSEDPREVLEWAAYHRLQGFGPITVYANEDPSGLRRSLAAAEAGGLLRVVDWWWPKRKDRDHVQQQAGQVSCLYRSRGRVRWLGLHDIDEFWLTRSAYGNDTLLRWMGRELPPDAAEQYSCVRSDARRYGPGFANRFKAETGLVIDRARAAASSWRGSYKCLARPELVTYFSAHEVTLGLKPVLAHTMGATLVLGHYAAPDTCPMCLGNRPDYDPGPSGWAPRVLELMQQYPVAQ